MAAQEKTVLVVDDEEALRTLAAKLIERRGHKVLTAGSGTEALGLFADGAKIDLVVLDVMMPGLDGLQTLEALRERGHQLPVLLLTAQSGDDDILGGYKRGADCYLTKPLKPASLLNVVDYLIGDLSPEERARLEPLL